MVLLNVFLLNSLSIDINVMFEMLQIIWFLNIKSNSLLKYFFFCKLCIYTNMIFQIHVFKWNGKEKI
jgi:hypothetical protein